MVSISFKGISGYPVAKSIRVRISRCPAEGGGLRGPAISTATLRNGCVTMGKGRKGTGDTRPFAQVL